MLQMRFNNSLQEKINVSIILGIIIYIIKL